MRADRLLAAVLRTAAHRYHNNWHPLHVPHLPDGVDGEQRHQAGPQQAAAEAGASGAAEPHHSDGAALAQHWRRHFFRVPEHLQPPAAGSGAPEAVWYGSRDVPILLALPKAAEGGTAAGVAAGADDRDMQQLNGFGAVQAAAVAQAFVAKFGAISVVGASERGATGDHLRDGFAVFFVPLLRSPGAAAAQ